MVCYSYDVHSTIAPAGTSCQSIHYHCSQRSQLGLKDCGWFFSLSSVHSNVWHHESQKEGKLWVCSTFISSFSMIQLCGIFRNSLTIAFWKMFRKMAISCSVWCVSIVFHCPTTKQQATHSYIWYLEKHCTYYRSMSLNSVMYAYTFKKLLYQ